MLLSIDCLILKKKMANKEMHDTINEEKCFNELGCKI